MPFWNTLARANPKVNICENLLMLELSKLGFCHTTLSSQFHLKLCMHLKYLMLVVGKEIQTYDQESRVITCQEEGEAKNEVLSAL